MTSNDQQSTPLNAEEETSLRLSFGQGRITGEPPYYFETIARLLATLDAARERPSALDVERLLHAADIALGVQEVARQAGNADLFAALEPLRHAVRAARLTEPDAGEGTERPARRGSSPDSSWKGFATDPDVIAIQQNALLGRQWSPFDTAEDGTLVPETTEATLPVPPYHDDRGDLQEAWMRGYHAALQQRPGVIRERPSALDDHPGEPHEFDVHCKRCGKPGMVNLSIITPDETVTVARLTEPDAGEKFSGWMDPADCADCTPDTTEATPLTGRFIDTHEGTVLVQDGNHIRGATSLELEFRAALQQPAVQSEEPHDD